MEMSLTLALPYCLKNHLPPDSLTEQDKDDRVAAQEHLADESVLVDFATQLSVRQSRCFRPHLFRVLENHVAVTIEGFYTGKQLAVVSARNEDLGACADGRLQDGERTGCELVLLNLCDFIFRQLGPRLGEQLLKLYVCDHDVLCWSLGAVSKFGSCGTVLRLIELHVGRCCLE